MSETNAQEPTMEEILASIRRIISEDDAPPTAAAAPEPAPAAEFAPPPVPAAPPPLEEDVLELTEPVDPPRPEPAKPQTYEATKYEETLGDLDVFSTHAAPPPPAKPAPAFAEEPLVGSYAAETSAGHFGALARTIAMPKEGRTLEDLVREMLKPMLRDWLDQNLSSIVEARVQAEVERISRRQDY